MSTISTRLRARLRASDNGCLVWTGATNTYGYGNIYSHSIARKTITLSTHRAAWALANGPIPDGMDVLHTCDNPPCCNPDHLFLGTQADNMKDKSAKGRALPGPVSRRSWWSPERREQHKAKLLQSKSESKAACAIAAGVALDWKRCPTCKQWKSPSQYNRNRARQDGLQAHCKPCKHSAELKRDRERTGRRQRSVTRSDKIHF